MGLNLKLGRRGNLTFQPPQFCSSSLFSLTSPQILAVDFFRLADGDELRPLSVFPTPDDEDDDDDINDEAHRESDD